MQMCNKMVSEDCSTAIAHNGWLVGAGVKWLDGSGSKPALIQVCSAAALWLMWFIDVGGHRPTNYAMSYPSF